MSSLKTGRVGMLILKVRRPSSSLETRTLVMSTPSGFSPVASWQEEVLAATRANDAGATVSPRESTVIQRSRVLIDRNNAVPACSSLLLQNDLIRPAGPRRSDDPGSRAE